MKFISPLLVLLLLLPAAATSPSRALHRVFKMSPVKNQQQLLAQLKVHRKELSAALAVRNLPFTFVENSKSLKNPDAPEFAFFIDNAQIDEFTPLDGYPNLPATSPEKYYYGKLSLPDGQKYYAVRIPLTDLEAPHKLTGNQVMVNEGFRWVPAARMWIYVSASGVVYL